MLVQLHAKSIIVEDIPGFVRESDTNIADADLTAEEAGRLCYLSGHRPSKKTATNGRYLLNICAQKHYSVLGHSWASIYVETSRNTTHEIIRSRWFTFSEVSQRFVNADKLGFEVHPDFPSEFGLVAADHNEHAVEVYDTVASAMETHGFSHKEARQAARSVLPGGTRTMILISGNLRAWRDFLAQRLAPGADLEIQTVAREIYKIMKQEFPNSFQDFDHKGMITHERLIQRALDRYDRDLLRREHAVVASMNFIDSVREIQEKGLWVLRDDPWEEDKL